ncbi:MAG: lytic transglycosylase domain-containing protein [Nibricoccus sp.]
MRASFFALFASLACAQSTPTTSSSAEPSSSAKSEASRSDKPAATATPDSLFDLGKSLFDEYAPPEVKEYFEFPSKEQWDAFAAKLQKALDGDSFGDLAAFEPQARAALTALRAFPEYEDYANWLEERLDLISMAKQLSQPPTPPRPDQPKPPTPRADIPQYNLWFQRISAKAIPANAEKLIPLLVAQFASAGSPGELAWLAEVESTFNPAARSPAGARGLFQLMPETAKELGLSVMLPDERTDPKKSADAAARLLKRLYSKFGDWPLALAAYNAGEGRVSRALTARKAKTFAEIVPALSVETQLYVPKVLATVASRTGITPEKLAAAE